MAERQLKINIDKIFIYSNEKETVTREFTVQSVTVFVGPNNSGKSTALREIEQICTGIKRHRYIIKNASISNPETYEDAIQSISSFIGPTPPNHTSHDSILYIYNFFLEGREEKQFYNVNKVDLKKSIESNDQNGILRSIGRSHVLRLDGKGRFELSESKPSGNPGKTPKNHLWALLSDHEARNSVREFTESAFGLHFVIDGTEMRRLHPKLSKRPPENITEEQAYEEKSRRFHEDAYFLSEMGDGVKSSVGLVSAVMSMKQSILLIDEPEAFLHPSLSRRVGRTLAANARARETKLIVATHSPDFLMGCIQSAPDTRIIRLTHEDGIGTARSLEPTSLMELVNKPLLRSTNAFNAMFARGVVVCESDSDRAFYDEINQRLTRQNLGLEDCFFLNGQNWQTIPEIVMPLRRLGIPAAAILDIDVIAQDEFKKIWPLIDMRSDKLQALQEERVKLKSAMDAVGKSNYKKQGKKALAPNDTLLFDDFAKQLATYGVFIVPGGELESWLSHLGVPNGHAAKSNWLTRIFELIGADPNMSSYISADPDDLEDVWEFVHSISTWINDPHRLGIPDAQTSHS